MLKPEEAQKRLDAWRLPEDENRVLAAVRALPDDLRDHAARVLELVSDLKESGDDEAEDEEAADSSSRNAWEEVQRGQRESARFLDATPAARRTLFELVSPALAPAIESAWQLIKTTPYQTGYERRAFRSPSDHGNYAEKHGDWLANVARMATQYRPEQLTPTWLATWAAHLTSGYRGFESEVGLLLGAVLHDKSTEADEVFEILRQSLTNQHEIGGMGRHVYKAMLLSDREAGWELIEKTLLAAERQEGLRQAILESIDETHPAAFRRMLRIILDRDLIRFSAVVRAVDVWFGNLWTAATPAAVKKVVAQLVELLDDPAARKKALAGKEPEGAFLALWCLAADDAVQSIPAAQQLLKSKSVEMRYVAARHLELLNLPAARAALVPLSDDEDLRIALFGLVGVRSDEDLPTDGGPDDHFERIERLLERIPAKPLELKALVWPWTARTVKQNEVAQNLLYTRGDRPASRLIPHLEKFDSYGRRGAIDYLVEKKPWPDDVRESIVELAGDTSADVRTNALAALTGQTLRPAELQRLESYLARKAGDLRRGILALLVKQDDVGALASAARLTEAKDAGQRLAGLELLRLLSDAGRAAAECRAAGEAYRAARKKTTKEEQAQLDEIAKEKTAVAVLDDALGLMNPADRSPIVAPRNLKVPFITAAACALLKSLDDLVHKHRETSIRFKTYSGPKDELLGNIRWGFPTPEFHKKKQKVELPLREVWEEWYANRGAELRDADGFELVRARLWVDYAKGYEADQWKEWAKSSAARKKVAEILSGGNPFPKLRYDSIVNALTQWLDHLHPAEATDYLLDAAETAFSLVPAEDLKLLTDPEKQTTRRRYYSDDVENDFRDIDAFKKWNEAADHYLGRAETNERSLRHWRLLAWRDRPIEDALRDRPYVNQLLWAYEHGAANLADVADHLLGPRGRDSQFYMLDHLTERKHSRDEQAQLARLPDVVRLGERAVERILEIELTRGDAPTAATAPAQHIAGLYGIETARRILAALGKAEFKTTSRWSSGREGRRETFTILLERTFPAEGETPADFAKLMKAAVARGEFPEERLLQLTFLAPQWTKAVEAYFGWEHMSEGVYWFLAHMRQVGGLTENAALAAGEVDDPESAEPDDDEDDTDEEASEASADGDGEAKADEPPVKVQKLSAWERLIVERTPLTDADRGEGAIDVAWFRRTHEQLGDKRWQALAVAARFAATPAQAKNAALIADVLLNKVKRKDLVDGIKKKQLKDRVRLLGLLPLATGTKRETDLKERCQVLRDYRRYADKLSGLTKPSALRAYDIGMKNLAQTAGFADALRLEWAVGAEAVKDLIKGSITVAKGDVKVTLSLNSLSQPKLQTTKAGKELKSIPPAIKKDKKVAALIGRVTDLKRQASAIRKSLEAAMCRGDTFTGDELKSWCGHALVAPLLTRLVVVGDGILGYPDKQGKALRDYNGKLEPVKAKEVLRLAHPHDLLKTKAWQHWQRECFQAERVQPFKQVFRELYVVTKQEKQDKTLSHRYDGHQIQPRQGTALFGSRGWNTGDGIFKVFHESGLTATVGFQHGVTTPAEVEAPAIGAVWFTRRDEWKPMPLTAVPPNLFSEVMRDLELVVAVAHAGGVDPEAAASTVEMRSALLRETAALLKLKNVRLKPAHALIDGEYAQYSVHLGSGTVHRMPGGSLCIVPVHAQQRGRVFLPFADDDPRTAEVVSKVLLLARDNEIQDPTILEQIRRQ